MEIITYLYYIVKLKKLVLMVNMETTVRGSATSTVELKRGVTEQQDSVREDVKLVGKASRVINVRFAYFLSFFFNIVFGFLLKYILSISKISTINSKQ